MIHATLGLVVIVAYLALAVIGWLRLRRNEPPTPALRAAQGVAHLLLTLQVLVGIGLVARGGLATITILHPIIGLLALAALFLPLLAPALRRDRARAFAIVPTVVLVLTLVNYAIGEMRP